MSMYCTSQLDGPFTWGGSQNIHVFYLSVRRSLFLGRGGAEHPCIVLVSEALP